MTEKPIIFNAADIRAILDGSKKQVWRTIKQQPAHSCHYTVNGNKNAAIHLWTEAFENKRFDRCFVPVNATTASHILRCPFGGQGDRLWVKESWLLLSVTYDDYMGGYEGDWYHGPIPDEMPPWGSLDYRATAHDPTSEKWRPSSQMPRWASRILLEITDLDVKRSSEPDGPYCWIIDFKAVQVEQQKYYR